ncbi:MAG: diol dehydratase small subunit [Streptococcaceae bacterium]|jgi:propanediol dehydratase small subunit|nr:diol dehydratase small subunit [Streptococcaceae bacterium]
MSDIDALISKIKEKMATTDTQTHPTDGLSVETMTRQDYPLYQKHPELVESTTGKSINEITLEKILSGEISGKDMRITKETLRRQGDIAKNAGRMALKGNFDRAAELTALPDARVLEIYGALRPYRSTKADLLAIADELENKYNAKINAAFVREAAEHYEGRKKLKGDN